MSARTDLVDLRRIASEATTQETEPYFTTHGDPLVIERGTAAGGRFHVVSGPSTEPADYGRANCMFTGTFDPATCLGLLDRIDQLTEALDKMHLASIAASNPGIDIEDVKRIRAAGAASPAQESPQDCPICGATDESESGEPCLTCFNDNLDDDGFEIDPTFGAVQVTTPAEPTGGDA